MAKFGDFLNRLRADSLFAGAQGGWSNSVQGYGTVADGASAWVWSPPREPSIEELTDLYLHESIARKAVDAVIEDALRQGFSIGTDQALSDAWLKKANKAWDFQELVFRTLSESRLYGGVGLLPVVSDGAEDMTMPLRLRTVGEVRAFHRIAPDRAQVVEHEVDPEAYNYTAPLYWNVSLHARGGVGAYLPKVHHTRFKQVLGGHYTERALRDGRTRYPDWPPSVLTGVMQGLQRYRAAMAAMASLLGQASQGVYKIQNLNKKLLSSAENASELRAWMQIQNLMRSAVNAITLDAGGDHGPEESFERVEASVQGVSELIDRFAVEVAEALGMPVTKLFGRAPGGLNTDDESGRRAWYDHVRHYQEQKATPLIEWLVSLVSQDPRVGPAPSGEIEWPSLWQFSPMEEAQARLTTAQSDAVYLQYRVVEPEDVRVIRAQPDGWRLDLEVDESLLGPIEVGDPDGSEPG